MKINKNKTDIIMCTSLGIVVCCMVAIAESDYIFEFILPHLAVFLSLLAVLSLISVICFFLGNLDLDFKLKEIRSEKNKIFENAKCDIRTIQNKWQDVYKVLKEKKDILDILLSQEKILNAIPDLKDMLHRLEELNEDYYKTLSEKCKIFVQYLEECMKGFKSNNVFDDQKQQLYDCRMARLSNSLLRKSKMIDEITNQMQEKISILEKQAGTEEFVANLKNYMDYTCFQLYDEDLDYIAKDYKISIGKLRNYVLKEEDIIKKLFKADKKDSVAISDVSVPYQSNSIHSF